MAKFTVTHEIRCDADTFWKTFFDKTFNERLYLEALKFPEFKTVDQSETDKEITRKVRAMPKVNMPGPVMKLIGSNFTYVEEGVFDKATKVWRWKLTPSTLAEKLHTSGVVRIEPIGDSKVRRVSEITIEAKIFGLGGLIESSTEKQMREGWDESAVFMNKYLESAPK